MKTRRTGIAFLLLSLVLLLTPVASAQTSGDAVPGAITVTAEGTASHPAEQVKVVITLGPDTNAYYEPATGMPIEGAEPLVIDASVVTNAMVEYGVPVNDIEIVETPFTGEWGANAVPMPITVVATILTTEKCLSRRIIKRGKGSRGFRWAIRQSIRSVVFRRGLPPAQAGSPR